LVGQFCAELGAAAMLASTAMLTMARCSADGMDLLPRFVVRAQAIILRGTRA
jgi:hypothetical protein